MIRLIAAVLFIAFGLSAARAQGPVKLCFPSSATRTNCIVVSPDNPLPITGSFSLSFPTIGAAVPLTGLYNALNVAGVLRGMTGLALGSTYSQTVAVVDGSGAQVTSFGSSAAVGATGAAVPASASYVGINVGGTLTGWTGALTAGSAVIGKTGIDQTTPGTTNLVALTAETTKVIGTVRGASGGFASGTFAAGSFAAGSYAAGALASGSIAAGAVAAGAYVSGSVLSGAYASGALVDITNLTGSKAAGTAATSALLTGAVFNSSAPSLSNGQQAALQFDSAANLKVTAATLDPCQSAAKISFPISQTTSTQLISGTASKKTYICSMMLTGADAENVSLVMGTGTVCATGVAAVIGNTTAANGVQLAANGGFALGSGIATIANGVTNADNVCLLQSGSGRIGGVLTYVQN